MEVAWTLSHALEEFLAHILRIIAHGLEFGEVVQLCLRYLHMLDGWIVLHTFVDIP